MKADPIYEYLQKQEAHKWLLFFNPESGNLEIPEDNNIAIKLNINK